MSRKAISEYELICMREALERLRNDINEALDDVIELEYQFKTNLEM